MQVLFFFLVLFLAVSVAGADGRLGRVGPFSLLSGRSVKTDVNGFWKVW